MEEIGVSIRGAALLAAVGSALWLASSVFSSFLSWLWLASYGRGFSLDALRFPLLGWLEALAFGAALPVFFFLLYRSQPLLFVPAGLKKVAWVAAVARGLSGIPVVLRWVSGPLSQADPFGDAAQRMSHPIPWALQRVYSLVVAPSISLFAALALLLFFVSVARTEIGSQTISRQLKAVAVWAGVVAAVQAVFLIFGNVNSEIMRAWYQPALQTMDSVWLWNRILRPAMSFSYQVSLAAFFFVFCWKLRAGQSSQRLSTGA
jgi:hypothetical protein